MLVSDLKPKQFKNAAEFKSWMKKNHLRETSLGVVFQKKSYGPQVMTQAEANNIALCFGWTWASVRSLDYQSFMIIFTRRKAKSAWSAGTVKLFKMLQRKKLVQPNGLAAFKSRKTSTYENPDPEFSKEHLARFKKNKTAWAFFSAQTPSYQKYMKHWVLSAKQAETREKRIAELIVDSANETKLKRLSQGMSPLPKRYAPGETPVEVGKNVGPKLGTELRSLGIDTLEKLKSMGWEEASIRLCEAYPERRHLMVIRSIIGAVEDQSVRSLDSELKSAARALLHELRNSRY